MTILNSAVAALLLGMAWSAGAAQPSAAGDALLGAARDARARGCRGAPGSEAPLRWSDALARAARRIERGERATEAVQAEGYRATRVFHSVLTGYRTGGEVVAAIAQRDCTSLANTALSDIGYVRDGSRWLVVLAEPLALPQLANRREAITRVLALTNEARSQARRCGDQAFAAAPPLAWNEQLAAAAERHARDMASHAFIAHEGHDGSTPVQRVDATGYRWRAVAENVAAGQPSADAVVQAWLRSPGHCANIMAPALAEIGIDFELNLDSDAAVYWAQEFGTRAARRAVTTR